MDISKLSEVHRESFKQLIGLGVPEKTLQQLYNKLLILAKTPQEDWGKKSTTDKVNQ